MHLNVNGFKTYCYTGGKAFEAAKPTVVFIHGVLHDHSVWILQTRYLANHGWNVLAVDLPGHCRSPGKHQKRQAHPYAFQPVPVVVGPQAAHCRNSQQQQENGQFRLPKKVSKRVPQNSPQGTPLPCRHIPG